MEITVTDMSKSLSDIISRVYYKGETFNIKKGRNVFAKVSPVNSRKTLRIENISFFLRGMPVVDSDFLEDIKDILWI